jgi:RimJ/RimL family protein N-acetyltransferase
MHPWPLLDLRIRTPALELRLPTDEELFALADRAVGQVLDPEQAAFMGDWTQQPAPQFRGLVQHHWLNRAQLSPDSWHLALAAFVHGDPVAVGCQALSGEGFNVARKADTGSWLVRDAQCGGLGTQMRAAVLQLAFCELGAFEAHTDCHVGNHPSQGVTRKLGYEPNRQNAIAVAGQRAPRLLFRLTAQRFVARDDIEIFGANGLRELLGL